MHSHPKILIHRDKTIQKYNYRQGTKKAISLENDNIKQKKVVKQIKLSL